MRRNKDTRRRANGKLRQAKRAKVATLERLKEAAKVRVGDAELLLLLQAKVNPEGFAAEYGAETAAAIARAGSKSTVNNILDRLSDRTYRRVFGEAFRALGEQARDDEDGA